MASSVIGSCIGAPRVAEAELLLPLSVYSAVGASEGNSSMPRVENPRAFTEPILSRNYRGLKLRADVLDDETHNSVFPRALSNGLRFVLDGR